MVVPTLVSVLFNEPKLLKYDTEKINPLPAAGFSALQRAEIAEINHSSELSNAITSCFSALQRAEIAEMLPLLRAATISPGSFSALQRAEIAEITARRAGACRFPCFSALQRAEIAEMLTAAAGGDDGA